MYWIRLGGMYVIPLLASEAEYATKLYDEAVFKLQRGDDSKEKEIQIMRSSIKARMSEVEEFYHENIEEPEIALLEKYRLKLKKILHHQMNFSSSPQKGPDSGNKEDLTPFERENKVILSAEIPKLTFDKLKNNRDLESPVVTLPSGRKSSSRSSAKRAKSSSPSPKKRSGKKSPSPFQVSPKVAESPLLERGAGFKTDRRSAEKKNLHRRHNTEIPRLKGGGVGTERIRGATHSKTARGSKTMRAGKGSMTMMTTPTREVMNTPESRPKRATKHTGRAEAGKRTKPKAKNLVAESKQAEEWKEIIFTIELSKSEFELFQATKKALIRQQNLP